MKIEILYDCNIVLYLAIQVNAIFSTRQEKIKHIQSIQFEKSNNQSRQRHKSRV